MKKIILSMASYEEALKEARLKARQHMEGLNYSDEYLVYTSEEGFYVEDTKIVEKVSVRVSKSGYQSRVIKSFAV